MLVAVSMLLAGCPASLPRLTIQDTKYVLVKPDAAMLKDCPFPTPMDVSAYMALSLKQREGVLYGQSIESMDTIATCNVQWKSLREWYTKQEKIYPDQPPAAEKK